MNTWKLQVPVVFLIFNRPDTTERVFKAIAQAKPPKLLIVADGPRADVPGEAQKCAAARAILDRVDWDCQVFKNYSDVNLGCRKRVSSGLNWVFETVEEAIILEDDCLPHPTFFRFCEELLERYRFEKRVFAISGNNFQFGRPHTAFSYYFSRYAHIWGWATWKRAWQLYDSKMQNWPRVRGTDWLKNKLKGERAAHYWSRIFQAAYEGFNSWAYAWVFTCWFQEGFIALPHINLVSNIGFRADATHTVKESQLANIPIAEMNFPLQHPQNYVRNERADNFTETTIYSGEIYPQNNLAAQSNTETQSSNMNFQILSSQLLFLNNRISQLKESMGRIEYRQIKDSKIQRLQDAEFQVYSQWGEDGIIQFLIDTIPIQRKIFVEFGVENYTESNTRFLLTNNNWSGLVIDGSEKNINYIRQDPIYWRYNLKAICNFVTKDNINHLISSHGVKDEIGLLSIDIDGNDYWVWDAIHVVNPAIVIIEYNFRFGVDRAVTIPYQENFVRSQAHHSTIYFGASLKALCFLAQKKGYAFVGCNSAGNNAFFVRRDLKPDSLPELTVERGYVAGQYRESRNEKGQLNYLSPQEEQKIIHTLPLVEVYRDENQYASRNRDEGDRNQNPNPKVIVDAVFFQLYRTGIARVWRSLLQEWSTGEFGQQILVLDRDGTAPKIPNIQYLGIPRYDYDNTPADRQMLQDICDRENADVFISSYYTTPLTTPSVFMAYDMIPEIAGYDPNDPMWREKKYGLQHASAYISISDNTARDLVKFFPQISRDSITVATCGVASSFSQKSPDLIQSFKSKYQIAKPYFMLSGVRIGYKNAMLFFQAFAQLENKHEFEIICTGSGRHLEQEFHPYVSGTKVTLLHLDDDELSTAYSGATALAFLSQYEGFGLPVLEAMACGCPVITCRTSSIPEVAGNAVIYASDRDVEETLQALRDVQKPEVRQSLIAAGLERAQLFSWSKMADRVRDVLVKTASQPTPISSTPAIEISPPNPNIISEQIRQYQNHPTDSANLAALRRSRLELARYWLSLSPQKLGQTCTGELANLHQTLWLNGPKNERLTEEERNFTQHLATKVARGFEDPEAIPALLASTLYFYPHQLEIHYQHAPIPNWFASGYMSFMFESPRLFSQLGEVDRYHNFLSGWIGYLHENISRHPNDSVWQQVTRVFARIANLTPAYFSHLPQLEIQQQRAEIIERYLTQKGCQLDYTFPPRSRSKIRVGFLCQHFDPSAETFTILPVFEHLDRTRFEVYLYALNASDRPLERYCRSRADRFLQLPHQGLNPTVDGIRSDDLDILLIGSNITAILGQYAFPLLSVHRLARIQTIALSSPVTTGMRNIDYYIAGTLTVPPVNPQAYYTEQLVTVEGSGLCFCYGEEEPAVATINPTRESLGATSETTIFISGANFRKINPELRHTWAKVLAATPNSILVLYPFGPNWGRHPQLEQPFEQQMQAVLAQYGVDTQRLVLLRTLPSHADIPQYLELADVYLDSYLYSGAASVLDPLRANLPLVVMEGEELRARQSSALLRELQIRDLIVRNEDEYIRCSVSLGTNPQLRQLKRQQIQQQIQQSPPFLDSRAYGAKMAALFEAMVNGNVESHRPRETSSESSSRVTPPNLSRLLECVSLFQRNPAETSITSELSQLRRQLAEYFLNLPTAQLETVYQGEVGQVYQTLLKSGFQTQPIPETDRPFMQKLTQQGAGFTHPQALNAFLGVMLYYAPGTMKVQDSQSRLPGWIVRDYQEVFEAQTPSGTSPSPQPEGLSTEFLNRLLGCTNLYEIDPSEPSAIEELHQLRRQLAEYWLRLPMESLESIYRTQVGQHYQGLLRSGFQKEPIGEGDRAFLQQLSGMASGSTHPKWLNALLGAMLYYEPGKMKVQDARTRLPAWLIDDYEGVFETV